jgi:hypothetical protein
VNLRALREDKPFKNAVTVLLAGLTILGSLLVVLNNRAAGLDGATRASWASAT